MKKTYTVPQLLVHGRIEDITRAFGSSTAPDTVYIGGQQITVPGLTGSQDGVIVPKTS